MTSRLDVVRANSRAVVNNSPVATSERAWYRALSSQSNARPQTYGEWLDIWGLFSALTETEQFDNDRNAVKLVTIRSFRVGDDQPRLSPGWQIYHLREQTYWQVVGIESEGPGTIRWQLTRVVGLLGTPDRKTGV